MEANYFECKIQYNNIETGKEKKVTETYLVEAYSFAEAEERFLEEITPYMTTDYEVAAVNKRKYVELFDDSADSADRWYKVKLSVITFDEKSGTEKEKSLLMLVQSDSCESAIKRLNDGMKDSMMNYDIKAIVETSYMDIYRITE